MTSSLADWYVLAHSAFVRKRFYLAGIILLLVLIGFGVRNGMRTREPRYKGKPLSFWLQGGNGDPQEVLDAIDHIGTNSIPTLLRMLQASDSKAKQKLADFLDEQNLIRIHIDAYDADDLNAYALEGFDLLGARAEAAVGPLLKLHEKSPPDRKFIYEEALGSIGPAAKEAIPVLQRRMTDSNITNRASAAFALLRIGADPELLVQPFIRDFTNSDQRIRVNAAYCLAEFGTNAIEAIPALIASANDPDKTIRIRVIKALGNTRAKPELVVPVLTNALCDSVKNIRDAAVMALRAFGTNSGSAIPLLIAISGTNLDVPNQALITLGEIHSRPELTVPVLINALTNRETWRIAAESLEKFGSEATSAAPALIKDYRREQKRVPENEDRKVYRLEVIRGALLKIDPAAAAQAGISTNPPAE